MWHNFQVYCIECKIKWMYRISRLKSHSTRLDVVIVSTHLALSDSTRCFHFYLTHLSDISCNFF